MSVCCILLCLLLVYLFTATALSASPHKLSIARCGIAAATVGGRYAVFGGGTSAILNGQIGDVYDNIDVYDSINDTWSVLHLSQARFVCSECCSECMLL